MPVDSFPNRTLHIRPDNNILFADFVLRVGLILLHQIPVYLEIVVPLCFLLEQQNENSKR